MNAAGTGGGARLHILYAAGAVHLPAARLAVPEGLGARMDLTTYG